MAGLLGGCNLASQGVLPPPPPQVVAPMLTQQAPSVGGVPLLSDQWQAAASGMWVRQLLPGGDILKTLVAVRLDATQYAFKVHYRPGQPLTLSEWQTLLPDAALIINANFFHPDNTVVGMVITDEGAFGQTFVNRGGMFSVQNGLPVLQSLINAPYDGRWLDYAVQGFPSLIVNSAASGLTPNDNRASRRTLIAIDAQGNIVIIATPIYGPGLYDLSQYLAASDLQLTYAVNLDGGSSTMMLIAPINYQISSLTPVPTVLAVYKR